MLQDRRIDFARIDIRDPDTVVPLFERGERAEGRHGEFRRAIRDAPQPQRPLAGDRRDIDDQAVAAGACICGRAACRQWKAPVALIAMSRSHSSGAVSASERCTTFVPAEFTRISRGPSASAAQRNRAATLPRSATSAAWVESGVGPACCRRRLAELLLAPPGDRHSAPLGGQRGGDAQPNARSSAGDQGRFAGEFHGMIASIRAVADCGKTN